MICGTMSHITDNLRRLESDENDSKYVVEVISLSRQITTLE